MACSVTAVCSGDLAHPIPLSRHGFPGAAADLPRSTRICGTARSARCIFFDFTIRERCGHMSGLLARPMTAGLDEVREASGFIRGACCNARRGFRPGLLRDVVPLVHRFLCTSTCRPLPVSSCARFCSSRGNAVRRQSWRTPVCSSSDQEGPDHPCRLVGKCNRNDLERPSCDQLS